MAGYQNLEVSVSVLDEIYMKERLAQIEEISQDSIWMTKLPIQETSLAVQEQSTYEQITPQSASSLKIVEKFQMPSLNQDGYIQTSLEAENQDNGKTELANMILDGAKKKEALRIDEISKLVVRKIFKQQKKKFQIYLAIKNINIIFPQSQQEIQTLLVDYLMQTYGIQKQIIQADIIVAKSLCYNFIARRKDQSLEKTEIKRMRATRIEFCEKGTKKEAFKFFESILARKIVYPHFIGALKYVCLVANPPKSLVALSKLIKRFVKQLEIKVEGLQKI